MAVIQDININVHGQPSEKRLQTFLRLSQNENGRMINFRVLGPPLPSNCTATFSGTKPDGNVYSTTGTVAGNFVMVQEDMQMTAVAGVWDATLDVVNGTHNIVTAIIRVIVERGTVAPGSVPSNSQLDGYVAQCKSYAEQARMEAYGSPLTAETKAQMTDHARVYVYTGSEPNMVAGNWYHWNGTAWVSGGVYNAVAVQTDTTLSVAGKAADGKATGDALDDLKEELSDIDETILSENFVMVQSDDTVADTGIDASASIGSPFKTKTANGYYLCEYSVAKGEYFITFAAYSLYGTYGCVVDANNNVLMYFGIAPSNVGMHSEIINVPDTGSKVYIGTEASTLLQAEHRVKVYKKETVKQKQLVNLPVTNFVQGSYSASGSFSNQAYYVAQPNCLVLPFGDKTRMLLEYDGDYAFGIRSGQSYNNLDSNQYWFVSGEPIDFKTNDNYFVITFAKNNITHGNPAITPDELDNINLKIYCEKIESNTDLKRAYASAFKFSLTNENVQNGLPLLLHISDIHGDFYRTRNFLDIAEKIKADVACMTGDFVANQRSATTNNFSWLHEEIKRHSVVSAICTGNHDLKITGNNNYTDADIYTDLYEPIASKIGNDTGKSWYYKDLPEKSLRIISINLYQFGGTTRNKTHFTDEQLAWFCDTLSNTPSGYGVVVLLHAPQTHLSVASNKEVFWQNPRKYLSEETYSEVTGDPIAEIVDAFISKTAISKSWNQSGNPASVSVIADFSSVAEGAEFIAYLAGHTHQDGICYVSGVNNKQLMLDITCAVPAFGGASYKYLSDCGDLVRNYFDETQDAINAYGIDRTNKLIKVARIGADATYQFTYRDWMDIPYAD